MRKRLLVPIAAMLLASLAGAQVPAAAPARTVVLTDWAAAGLKGRVSRLDATIVFDPTHSIRTVSEFDTRGYLSSEAVTSTYKGRVTTKRTSYRTDAQGRKLTVQTVRADATPAVSTQYVYERLYLAREERRDAAGALATTTTHAYDAAGKRTMRETVGGIRTTVAYRYAPSGSLAETTTVFHAGSSPATTVETYDGRGLVVRVRSTRDLNGRRLESTRQFEYEVDPRGNWVERVEYELQGGRRTPVTRENRRVTYYP